MFVVSGQVCADLAGLVRQMDQAEIKNAIITLLQTTKEFSELGEVKDRKFYGQAGARIPLQVGRYLLTIRGLRVEVNIRGRQRGDTEIKRQLSQAIGDHLANLAMMALQRRLTMAIVNAGYCVTEEPYRDADGAVVIEAGKVALIIELEGRITIVIREEVEQQAEAELQLLLAVLASVEIGVAILDQKFFLVPDSHFVT